MIVENKELRGIRQENPGESIALRFGCYDLLHEGHKEGLEFAAQQAGILAVGIMPDERVRYKGPDRPINSAEERVKAIDRQEIVDYSFIMPISTVAIMRSIVRLKPDVYVEHEEYKPDKLKSLFLRVFRIDYVIDHGDKVDSTSDMIARFGLQGAIAKSGF